MTDEPQKAVVDWGRHATRVALLALIFVRILLMGECPSYARHLNVDDSQYARGADSIAEGHWLGDYDENTLIKMPGYPVWLAGLRLLGIPSHLGQEILWILAGLALFSSLRFLGSGRFFAVLIFGATLFHPIAAWSNYGFLVRETIHHSQVLLIVALMLRFLADSSDPCRLRDSLLLGIATAFTWWSREESIWLIAVLGLGILPAAILEAGRRNKKAALKLALIALIPSLIFVHAAGMAIRALNNHHYGHPVTIAFEDEDFRAAMGAVMRAEPDPRFEFLPIQDSTMEVLFAQSPRFAELRPELMGGIYRHPGAVDAEGNRIANFFTFALRAAATQHGHHRTLGEAKRFYRKLAEEINSYLDKDPERFGPRRSSVIPPLRSRHLPLIAREAFRLTKELGQLTFRNHGEIPSVPFSWADEDLEALTKRVQGEPARPSLLRWQHRSRVLLKILGVFRLVLPWLSLAALALGLLRLVLCRRRSLSPLFLAGLVCLLVSFLRCGLVAAINVVYSPLDTNYLVAAFPLLFIGNLVIVFEVLGSISLPRLGWFAQSPLAVLLGLVLLVALIYELAAVSFDEPTRFLSPSEASAILLGPKTDHLEISGLATRGTGKQLRLSPEEPQSFLSLWPWHRRKSNPVDLVVQGDVAGDALPLHLVMTGRWQSQPLVNTESQREILEITRPGSFYWRLPLRAHSLDFARLNFVGKSLKSIEIRRFGTIASEAK